MPLSARGGAYQGVIFARLQARLEQAFGGCRKEIRNGM